MMNGMLPLLLMGKVRPTPAFKRPIVTRSAKGKIFEWGKQQLNTYMLGVWVFLYIQMINW